MLDQCSDSCGWIAAVLAALSFGSFGVPIKFISNVKVDPLVMQSYKSCICFLTCWLVIPLGEPFKFTPWGIVSGIFWVPGATAGIYGIRNAGLAISVGTWSSLIVISSFFWGIFVFHESVKTISGACAAAFVLVIGLVGMSFYSAPVSASHKAVSSSMSVSVNVSNNPDMNTNRNRNRSRNKNASNKDNIGSTSSHNHPDGEDHVEMQPLLSSSSFESTSKDRTDGRRDEEYGHGRGQTTTTSTTTNPNPTKPAPGKIIRRRNNEDTTTTTSNTTSSTTMTMSMTMNMTMTSERPLHLLSSPSGDSMDHTPDNTSHHHSSLHNMNIISGSSNNNIHIDPDPDEKEKKIDNDKRERISITIPFIRASNSAGGASAGGGGGNLKIKLTRRQLGIIGAVINGVWGSNSMIPMHYARKQGFYGAGYLISYSCGSMIITIIMWMIRYGYNLHLLEYNYHDAYYALPSFHIREMWVVGVLSGSLYSLGNFCSIIAVTALGQGVGYSFTQTSMLISGLWGIFYFKEVQGIGRISKWIMSSIITIIGILWLSYEHVGAPSGH